MKSCSILIANFNGHEAIELCIESILKKTIYPDYRILVLDSSKPDSQDRAYLTNQQQQENIELFTSDVQMRHANALMRLLEKCETSLACIIDSDVEILRGEWLQVLVDKLISPNDIGIAKLKTPGFFSRPPTTPIYQPFCMLLNMENYRKISGEINWQEKAIPIEEYKGRQIFPTIKTGKIYGDVGWQLAEKIIFDNPKGFVMREMPKTYMLNYIRHYGGLSAHHTTPDHPRMRGRWQLLKIRLKALRAT